MFSMSSFPAAFVSTKVSPSLKFPLLFLLILWKQQKCFIANLQIPSMKSMMLGILIKLGGNSIFFVRNTLKHMGVGGRESDI